MQTIQAGYLYAFLYLRLFRYGFQHYQDIKVQLRDSPEVELPQTVAGEEWRHVELTRN